MGVEILIFIPKETLTPDNFLGERGPDLLTPTSTTSLCIHNSEVKRIGSLNIQLFDKGRKLISLIVIMLCSVQNPSIKRAITLKSCKREL